MADWDVFGINWQRESWRDFFSSYSSLVGTISKACLSVMTWHWQISSVIRSTFSRLYYVSNKRGKINDVLESDIHHHHNSIYSSFFSVRSLLALASFLRSSSAYLDFFLLNLFLFWSTGAFSRALNHSHQPAAQQSETKRMRFHNPIQICTLVPPNPTRKIGRKWKKIEKIKINPL